jgi:hypothetical protein
LVNDLNLIASLIALGSSLGSILTCLAHCNGVSRALSAVKAPLHLEVLAGVLLYELLIDLDLAKQGPNQLFKK